MKRAFSSNDDYVGRLRLECLLTRRPSVGLRTLGAIVLLAILGPGSVSSAQARDLFYAWAGGGTDLIAIEVTNHHDVTTTLIGPTQLPSGESCPSLVLSPWGTLYSMCGVLFGSPGIQQLSTIDPETGQATKFGNPISGLSVMGMGFAADGNLYAAGGCCDPSSATYNSLYKVNVTTGAFTRIGSTDARLFLMDFTLDRHGNFYAVGSAIPDPQSVLYRVDPTSGRATKIVDLPGSPSIMGLAFDQHKRKLYATDYGSNNSSLFLVNIKTGDLTTIDHTGFANVHNLESVNLQDGSEGGE